ncbi:MAG: hypothetical protein HKN92_09200 [Chitinophagales bacterium]|nr:hypothetical protein [Chitinophagales bacterium]
MKFCRICASIVFTLFFTTASAQLWNSISLNDLPAKVSNNAVCGYQSNSHFYVYSFSGIDSSKVPSGINLNSYKYSSSFDTWTSIPPLPNGLSRIAASASLVRDKIYIIGGYHVAQNGNETSLSHVHIFDPESDQYLSDGSNTLIPIDDHVQVVWRDSLIYVITGWSNSNNVSAVQVYNPSTDSWAFANNLPDPSYRVFGAAGTIVEDTIYYIGGAGNWNGSTFPLIPEVRIGIIDPNNPLMISWQSMVDSNAAIYRAAAFTYNNKAHWLGGGKNSYNYDGIAYDGSGLVEASDLIRYFDTQAQGIGIFGNCKTIPVMDLRGIGVDNANDGSLFMYVIGGMDSLAEVTSKGNVYSILNLGGSEVLEESDPIATYGLNGISIKVPDDGFQLMDVMGRQIKQVDNSESMYFLPFQMYKTGVYTLLYRDALGRVSSEKLIMF